MQAFINLLSNGASEAEITSFLDENIDEVNSQFLLHIAVQYQHIEAITLLIDKYGANVQSRNNDLNTALHIAVNNALEETDNSRKDQADAIIKLLLNKKAALFTDRQGQTPLHIALSRNDSKIIELICNHLDYNEEGYLDLIHGISFINAVTATKSVQHYMFLLLRNKIIRSILIPHATALLIEHQNRSIREAFVLSAAAVGDVKSLKTTLTIEKSLFNASLKADSNHMAISLAAKYGKTEVIQFLLDNKLANVTDKFFTAKRSPFLLAAFHGQLAVVQLLLKAYGVDRENNRDRDSDHFTALLLAAAQGHLEMVQWLLTNKYASIKEKALQDHTALLAAAKWGHPEVVTWLLTEGGAEITEKNTSGKDAFQLAKDFNTLLCLCKYQLTFAFNISVDEALSQIKNIKNKLFSLCDAKYSDELKSAIKEILLQFFEKYYAKKDYNHALYIIQAIIEHTANTPQEMKNYLEIVENILGLIKTPEEMWAEGVALIRELITKYESHIKQVTARSGKFTNIQQQLDPLFKVRLYRRLSRPDFAFEVLAHCEQKDINNPEIAIEIAEAILNGDIAINRDETVFPEKEGEGNATDDLVKVHPTDKDYTAKKELAETTLRSRAAQAYPIIRPYIDNRVWTLDDEISCHMKRIMQQCDCFLAGNIKAGALSQKQIWSPKSWAAFVGHMFGPLEQRQIEIRMSDPWEEGMRAQQNALNLMEERLQNKDHALKIREEALKKKEQALQMREEALQLSENNSNIKSYDQHPFWQSRQDNQNKDKVSPTLEADQTKTATP